MTGQTEPTLAKLRSDTIRCHNILTYILKAVYETITKQMCAISLPDAVTLGGAYDGGEASPVSLHAGFCDL